MLTSSQDSPRNPEANTQTLAIERLSVSSALDDGISSGLAWLDEHQNDEGYWVGMLQSNSCMEAEWLLAFHVLGLEDHPLKAGLVRSLLREQREDGSWEIYHQAPRGDINATVESYAALRAAGLDANDLPLAAARQWIFDHGGLSQVRVFTRYWLAMIGEWAWEKTPNVPPEMIFLPSWFPLSIYNFSQWARATMVPISILSARRPCRPLPPEARLDELFPDGREHLDYSLPNKQGGTFSWATSFRVAERVLHFCQRLRFTPLRPLAVKHCLEWILKHQDADGAWGGIQPPWVYGLMALQAEGYPLSHPVMAYGLAALQNHWSYERDEATYIQASESPVWDTLLSIMALLDCDRDFPDGAGTTRALEWVLKQQVRSGGDWQIKVRDVEPGGWAFERANRSYPDIDDTAVALIVLAQISKGHPSPELAEAIRLAKQWLMAMQCDNGGWGAFDKNNDKSLLTRIPFCDFGEALDPPSVDVTAHVIEAFGLLGDDASQPHVARAIRFIEQDQEPDGSWFGRWGVNHIYGTAAVLPALHAVGYDMQAANVVKAADWIAAHQNRDGGWGESCASYMDEAWRGRGESTASQTGWALMALLATGSSDYVDGIIAGVSFLLTRQSDGTWDEPQYTGTGFPGYGLGRRLSLRDADLEALRQSTELSRGFMINYNMYRHYFPLMALGRARRFLNSVD